MHEPCDSAPRSARLRLATLNVWALPGSFSRDLDPRMEAIAAALPGLALDILCLQEVWTGDARARLLRGADRAGLVHHWHRDRDFGGSGLVIASRWPIERAHFRSFRLRGLPQRVQHADYYGGKGVGVVEIAAPAGLVTVANTHLHAAYERTHTQSEYRGHRAAQAIELALELAKVRGPLLLAGDLNIEDLDDEYAVLMGLSGCRDLAAEIGDRAATSSRENAYRSSRSTNKRIDYLLGRGGGCADVLPTDVERCFDEPIDIRGRPRSFSDHFGLRAEVTIRPRAALHAQEPRPEAVELAQMLLALGRSDTRERRSFERTGATAAGALAAASLATRRMTRRGVARLGLAALALGATLGGGGLLALAERHDPSELREYDTIEHELLAFAAGR